MKVHSVNGLTGRAHCGRDPEGLQLIDGLENNKVTCESCLRVANEVTVDERVHDVATLGDGYLDSRVPKALTEDEIRIPSLTSKEMDVIRAFARITSITGRLPSVTLPVIEDELSLVYVLERFQDIRMEVEAAISAAYSVRSGNCDPRLQFMQAWEDEEIAAFQLSRAVGRGLVSIVDIAWLHAVSTELSCPMGGYDKNARRLYDAELDRSQRRDRLGGDFEQEELATVAPAAEGQFGQVQVVDLGLEGLGYDMTLSFRVNSYDGSRYWDPKKEAKKAILGAVRQLLDRPYRASRGRLIWRFPGIQRTISAAARRGAKATSPWEVAIPSELLYRELSKVSDDVRDALLAVLGEDYQQAPEACTTGTTRWYTSRTILADGSVWVSRPLLHEEHGVLETTTGLDELRFSSGYKSVPQEAQGLGWRFLSRRNRIREALQGGHMVVKLWGNLEDWCSALGLEYQSLLEQKKKKKKTRRQRVKPPAVKKAAG